MNKATTAKPNRGRMEFPVPALWRFLDFLVKAGIAMEYPPREVPANIPNGALLGAVSAPTAGPNLPETMPPAHVSGIAPGHAGIVHFDLDPSNGIVHPFSLRIISIDIHN